MLNTDRHPEPERADPYMGADMELSRRMGAIIWALGLLLAVVLLPLSPPTDAIGGMGWIVTAGLIVVGVANMWALRTPRLDWTYGWLLASAYAGVAVIETVQWLSGGADAPYSRLLLLAVLYVAAVHPIRRIVPFMAVIGFSLILQVLYGGWDRNQAASALAAFFVWCALAAVAHLMIRGVRAQRVSLRAGESRARVEARLDGLTGIGNRRAFEEVLADEVARVRRLGSPLSVAMLDIERFKSVNDEFGHLEGDECLRALAAAITSELRAPDHCYRWGGDEFALILPGTRGTGADMLGERLRNFVSVACKRPDGEPLLIRYGTAQLEGGMSAEELVARADLSLGARLTG